MNGSLKGDDIADRQLLQLVNLLIIIALTLSTWFIFLVFFGYGTLRLQGIPSDAQVSINGHSVTVKTLTLRTGTYHLLVSSPFINTYETTLTIRLLQTSIASPQLNLRDPNSIAATLIGSALSQQTPPQVNSSKWFDNNTWVVGVLAASGNPVIAMDFDTARQQWQIAYYDAAVYPHDLTKLPPPIFAYVSELKRVYVAR